VKIGEIRGKKDRQKVVQKSDKQKKTLKVFETLRVFPFYSLSSISQESWDIQIVTIDGRL